MARPCRICGSRRIAVEELPAAVLPERRRLCAGCGDDIDAGRRLAAYLASAAAVALAGLWFALGGWPL